MSRGRLMGITLAPIALILVGILVVNLVTNTQRELELTKREMAGAVRTLSERFDGELRRVAQVAEQTGRAVTVLSHRLDLREEEIYALLDNGVLQDPLIYGAAMAFVAGGFEGRPAFSPYVYRNGIVPDSLSRLDIAGAYDYLGDPEVRWYADPMASGQPVWSEPYFDEGAGNIMMSTYSVPFRAADGRLLGVTTVDIPLTPLQSFVGTDLDVVVLSAEGRYIFRTDGIPDRNPSVFERLADRPDALAVARRMVAGESGIASVDNFDGEPQLVFFGPLPSANWSFALYVPEALAFAQARRDAHWLGAAMLATLALIAVAMWFVSGLVWRTQAETRASERRFRRLLASAPDAMVIVERDGTIVMVNDQAEQTFGHPAEAMIGQNVNMLMPERARETHEGQVTEFFAQAERRDMLGGEDVLGLRADGTEFPIEVGLSPLETADGLLVSSVVRDITERRKAEDELAQQRILLESTIDTIPDIIFLKDCEGRYLQCNPSCARLMGRDRDEIIGKTDYDLFDADLADAFRARDREVIDGGVRQTNEEWVTYPDGTERLLETSKVPYSASCGRVLGVLGVSRDITERHRAAEDLAAAEERQRMVLESTGEGIFGVNAEGRLMFINRAGAALLGYEKDELLGAAVHGVIHHTRPDGSPYPVEECPMHAAFTDGTASKIDDEVLWRKDGSSFDVEYTSAPLRKEGQLVGAVIVFHDITERKVAESQLLQARDAAQEANRAKSAFLANMSHELRTPMNAIIGYSEMLIEEAEDLEPEDFLPDLQKIHGAGKHLLSLISEILDLSKIEAGKMELYIERFDVGRMITEIQGTVDTLVKKRGNRFVVRRADGLGEMKSDQTKVRQTVFNLISNAAKFTEDGEIGLAVRRDTDDDGAEWLIFAVSDTGIGIPADKIDMLFEEFTQADDTTTREFGGTGLGLAITRRFCELLGGSIGCTSVAGEGSTFTIRLPAEIEPLERKEHAAAATEAAAAEAPADAPADLSGDRGRIVVIDDDPTIRELLARTLNRDGYEVLLAADGERGLELARKPGVVAITLDVMMPGLDGWSVLRALKADDATRSIPVIMVTIVDEKGMGYALGAAEYLTKPLDRGRLLDAVHRLEPGGDVLVVDDEPEARELTRRILESAGVSVREAADGREALAAVEDARPGLIVLDLMMPVMDGFEFLLRLREHPATVDLPVVVVTAKNLTEEDRDRLEGRVTRVLRKGRFEQDALLAEVRRVVERAGRLATVAR